MRRHIALTRKSARLTVLPAATVKRPPLLVKHSVLIKKVQPKDNGLDALLGLVIAGTILALVLGVGFLVGGFIAGSFLAVLLGIVLLLAGIAGGLVLLEEM